MLSFLSPLSVSLLPSPVLPSIFPSLHPSLPFSFPPSFFFSPSPFCDQISLCAFSSHEDLGTYQNDGAQGGRLHQKEKTLSKAPKAESICQILPWSGFPPGSCTNPLKFPAHPILCLSATRGGLLKFKPRPCSKLGVPRPSTHLACSLMHVPSACEGLFQVFHHDSGWGCFYLRFDTLLPPGI